MVRTEIELSAEDMLTAAIIGLRRHMSGMQLQRKHHVGEADAAESFDNHIIGACGEMAVAKAFNLYWEPAIGRIDVCDVGGVIEVKCQRVGRGFGLPLRPNHKPDKPYLLVQLKPPNRFFLVGWLYGKDAWAIGQPMNNFGVRAVPATLPPLRPVEELERIIFDADAA